MRKGKTPPPAHPGEVNWPMCDRFTLVHFGIGCTYAVLGLPFLVTLVLAVLWELVENPLKAYCPWIFPHATADTLRNSIGDSLAVCGGWICVHQFF